MRNLYSSIWKSECEQTLKPEPRSSIGSLLFFEITQQHSDLHISPKRDRFELVLRGVFGITLRFISCYIRFVF